MEKILHLYKYVDGVNDSPFPSNEQQATLYEFKYDAKRMGNNAPTITGTIMHPLCLDELWGNGQVYVFYNGERHFLKQTPTSSYSNEDTRYKHEVDFVSERALLNDVYFYDVVTGDVSNDKPVSNSSNVVFYGDIHELAKRLNYSLQYANLEYSVVVDEGITSESKLVSFQKQFFANVLQEGYKLFEIPYYYVGKVIHFGYTNNSIDRVFSQGVQDALLSISKNNITQRIVNRITGVGSADNIPYYYPNFDPKGETDVLYNGSTSNSVSIDNALKYKKIKLGDTFTYTYEDDKRIEYVDKENYEVVREPELVSENYEEFTRRYELAISFPLNVDIATDATLVLGYDKAFLKNFAALVYRGSELVTRLTSLGTYYNFRVKEDYTNITIALTFEFGFNDEKQEVTMDDIPNIVDSLVVSIYSDVQGYEQWSLNKESNIVSLSDYGLKLNSSPTNGDKITFRQVSYIPPQLNLMPPIYRESLGAERFYNALNNTYYDEVLGKYYSFDNPFIVGKNKEDDISFEDIKPSIKGVTNANSERIDMFGEFAWDENDSDEFDEEGNYLHPYFFGKLRRFDGDFGFNLFDHAIEEDEMVISMTSGNCGGCNFVIGVDDKTQRNTVQVDENGNLKRDSNGNVLYGSPQDRQNDTSKYEVWIALKKDIDTFGVIMPNATNNYKPNVGDTFVILHIDLPNAYILASEERLKDELIKYMANNNSEKFNFSLSFSRIFFAENPTLLSQLNENARIKIAYNNNIYSLYVSSYSYSMSNDSALPEIRVELSEELDIVKESIVKQLANASLYLNQEVKKVNMSVATTNTNVAKNSTTAQVSITQTNARVDDVEKVVRNIQAQGTQSGLNKTELEEYLTTNQYAKLSDIPSLEGYALASDLTALRTDFDNLNTLLNGNVGGVIDTWNEVVSFLDGYSQSDDLATILSGMNSDIANRVLIEDFEKLEGSVTEIAGYFTNGSANNALKLGGQLPSYYATADALNGVKNDLTSVSNRVQKFENVIDIDDNGDVYIKGTRNFYTAGGTISMFGLGEGDSGEVASVSIKFEGSDDVYSAVEGIITLPAYPSGGGGVADSVAWSNVTGKPDFAAVATSGKYSDLSGVPTSLPASDVYAWAKAASKPSYAFSEITGKPNTLGGYGITDAITTNGFVKRDLSDATWGTLTSANGFTPMYWLDSVTGGGIGISDAGGRSFIQVDGDYYANEGRSLVLHTANFSNYALPLSGGTLTGRLYIQGDGTAWITFKSSTQTFGNIGMNETGPKYWDGSASHSFIHSGNIGSQSVNYANSAEKANYLPIVGKLDYTTSSANKTFMISDWSSPYFYGQMWESPDGNYKMQLVRQLWTEGLKWRIMDSGIWNEWKTIIDSSNIGSYNAGSATKLQTARYIFGQPFDGSGNVDGIFTLYYDNNTRATGIEILSTNGGESSIGFTLNGNTRAVVGCWRDMLNLWRQDFGTILSVPSSGNVLIGTTSDNDFKLQVNGGIWANGGMWVDGVIQTTSAIPMYFYGTNVTCGLYPENWISSANPYRLWLYNDNAVAVGGLQVEIHSQSSLLINHKGNNYNEGIRLGNLNGVSSTWSEINFGCDTSVNVGTHAYQWTVGRSNHNNFVIRNYEYDRVSIDLSGNMYLYGNLVATGTIAMGTLSSSSDARLKDNIELLTDNESLAVLRQLRPSKWNWKSNGALSYGFIAQEVESVASCMVDRMNDEELGQKLYLQYNQLHAFEVGAIQHIDSEMEQLKRDLNTANLRIEKLENELKQYRLCQ